MTAFRRIDIHAHVNSAEFDGDRDAVMARALDAGTAVMNVGTDLESSRAAIALAESYPQGVFAVVGQHPTDTEAAFDYDAFKKLAAHPKVVGIGECGLDYFRLPAGENGGEARPTDPAAHVASQRETFMKQIELANEVGKPLMLHVRDGVPSVAVGDKGGAYNDAMDILAAHAKVKGNSHFFAGTTQEAKRFLDMGFTMSFTGVITFAKQYTELVEYVPLDMMHAETDCPYVAPVPHRGKRNEPVFVAEVVDKIARIKKLPVEEVEAQLLKNAQRMWGVTV